MDKVIKGIDLLQQVSKMKDVIKSTNNLHRQLQGQSYPEKKRRGVLGRTRKTPKKIQPKNNILDSLVQVMGSYKSNSNVKAEKESSFGHNVFETHDSIIARVKIPEGINPNKVKVFVGTSSASVSFDEKENRVIIFPQEIKKEETVAKVKEKVLEIKAPKLDKENMHEVSIH